MQVLTTQLFYGNGFKIHTIRVNGTVGIRPWSNVWATICEGDYQTPFVGNAKMIVCGVAPGIDQVSVQVSVEWGGPLSYRVTLFAA